MSSKSRIVTLIAAALVVVMGVLGVTVLPARASADQSDWTPTHATEEQLRGVLCHADDPAGDGVSVRYYFRAEDNPDKVPTLTLDDGRVLNGQYDRDNVVELGSAKVSKVVFKDYAKPNSIDFRYKDANNTSGLPDENKWLSSIEGIEKLDTSDITSLSGVFGYCSALESVDLSHFDTSKVKNMAIMFQYCKSLKSADISHLDLSSCKNFCDMFLMCNSLETADVSNPSTSSVTDMMGMFQGCWKLSNVNLDGLNTSSVETMRSMFASCSKLENTDLSTFDTSHVTDMSYMFADCSVLKNVSHLDGADTSAVTDMHYMFGGCKSLESLDVSGFNTANVTDMAGMFASCSSLPSLDVSGFNTANVTDMSTMFRYCSGVASLDVSKFNTSKVKYMNSMFANLNVESIDVSRFDTANVIDMSSMFEWCKNIKSVDVSNFSFNSAKNLKNMFSSCKSLEKIDLSNAEVTDVNASGLLGSCEALKEARLFHGTCSDISSMFNYCKQLKSVDISMISRPLTGSFKCGSLFYNAKIEQIRTTGELISNSNCSLSGTPLKEITIVANSGDLTMPGFTSSASKTISGKKVDWDPKNQRFGKGSEVADETVDMRNGGTLTGGAEDTSWYLQAFTHNVTFLGPKTITYKVFDGEAFNEEVPDASDGLPPFMRSSGWYTCDAQRVNIERLVALNHVIRDWTFERGLEWKDNDNEYHPADSYVVRVPSKISYEHQKIGTVDISTAYDVSVSGPSTLPKNAKLNLTASLSGFDGLIASVSDSDNGDIPSRLLDMDEITKPSDDNSFIAGKQLKDVLHLSGSVDSAKTITGHITYSCKPYFQPSPTPDPGSGEGGRIA